jgi:hypothetical protein
MERMLLAVVGIGMALFAGMMAAYFVTQLTSGTSENTVGMNAGLLAFFLGAVVAGLYLAWRMMHPKSPEAAGATRPGVANPRGRPTATAQPTSPPATETERERAVLKLAERQRGRVTVPEVAARCDMTISEAKAELDRMVLLHVAHMQVTGSGGLVYVFSGFMSDQEKAAAKDF